jgi:hypothetical protein
VNQIGRS